MVEVAFKLVVWAIVIALVVGLVGSVVFGWSLNNSPYLQGLTSFLAVIYYILPIDKLSPLIAIFVASMVFRIVVAGIRVVWSLIPGKDG